MFEPTFSQFFSHDRRSKSKTIICFRTGHENDGLTRKNKKHTSAIFLFYNRCIRVRRDDTQNTLSMFDKYVTLLDI